MRCCRVLERSRPPAPHAWVARAQPWLGTLVEVALPPDDATEARFAAAFSAIAHVHGCMSPPGRPKGEYRSAQHEGAPVFAHARASDLARIARAAHRRPVRVDRQTAAVLRLALRLARATQGRFDPTVPARGRRRGSGAGMQALRLAPGHRVRTAVALALDLGGIAKGHAVDVAIATLRASGAAAGLVNAGGDLRVFGTPDWLPVRVRLPDAPAIAPPLLEIRDAAAATSSDAFRGSAAALFDPRRRRARPFPGSITVVAPTCALADALTKVVALMPVRAQRLLGRFGAEALRIARGAAAATTTVTSSSARVRLAPRIQA